jgi:hypothetical protein
MIYSVLLTTCGNPDHGQNPYETLWGVPTERVYTASIEECQQRVMEYIDEYELGAGNWAGGEVYDGLGNVIGHISYNGRFWTKEAWDKLWS